MIQSTQRLKISSSPEISIQKLPSLSILQLQEQKKLQMFSIPFLSKLLNAEIRLNPIVPWSLDETVQTYCASPRPKKPSKEPPSTPPHHPWINYSDGAHPLAAMWTLSRANQKKHMVLSRDGPRDPTLKRWCWSSWQPNPSLMLKKKESAKWPLLIGWMIKGRG